MRNDDYIIRNARPSEFEAIGNLMIRVYSLLDGFPTKEQQPYYYEMLANVGDFTLKPGVALLTAVSSAETILGAVVYFNDMAYYGSGGTATLESDAAGFRLLAVDPAHQGKGIGMLLIHSCIEKARIQQRSQVIIHSTKAMSVAWKLYERLGFKRSEDLDFLQGELQVFGFRLPLV